MSKVIIGALCMGTVIFIIGMISAMASRKPKKNKVLLNQVLPERVLCSYCGCVMTSMRSDDWRGWRYVHEVLPTIDSIGCLNNGKTFKAQLTTLEVA